MSSKDKKPGRPSRSDSDYKGGEKRLMNSEAQFPCDSIISGDGGVGQSSTQSRSLVSSSVIVERVKRSKVWKHFRVERAENGEERAHCLKCPKSYAYFRNSGTSNLKRHQGICLKNLESEKKVMKIDDKVAREKFSRAIIRHDLPFSCVEYEELRDFISYIYPDYKAYTRNTAAADVVKYWEKEKQKLKLELEKIPSRICLTSDCWTAEFSGDAYIVLTAHYVDTKWVLNSKILSFCDILPPHSGDLLAGKVHEFLKEWEIEKKVFTLTVDMSSHYSLIYSLTRDEFSLFFLVFLS